MNLRSQNINIIEEVGFVDSYSTLSGNYLLKLERRTYKKYEYTLFDLSHGKNTKLSLPYMVSDFLGVKNLYCRQLEEKYISFNAENSLLLGNYIQVDKKNMRIIVFSQKKVVSLCQRI